MVQMEIVKDEIRKRGDRRMIELLFTVKRIKGELEKINLIRKDNISTSEIGIMKLESKLKQTKNICKLIEEDIELQKKNLKENNTEKNFEENKPFMWRIHGFQALLSRITGENFKFFVNKKEKEE